MTLLLKIMRCKKNASIFCGVLVFLHMLFSISIQASEIDKMPLNVQLTLKEQEYLKLKTKLTHCESPNWMPYSDNKNGVHVGITSDYTELFSKMLNIEFEYIPTTTWSDTMDKIKSRECDFVTAIFDKPSRRDFVKFSQGYLDLSLVLATRSEAPQIQKINALDGKRIGVVKGYSSTAYIKQHYPNLHLVEVDSLTSGLASVANNDLYGIAGTVGVLVYKIQNHYFNKLKINGIFTDSWKLSVGTRNDEPILANIMTKIITSIPEKTHRYIISNWLSDSVMDFRPNGLTLKELDFLEQHPTIRFRTRSNRPPFEYEVNGEVRGLAIDYIKHIANNLGFKAEFVVMDNHPSIVVKEMQKSDAPFDTMTYWVKSQEREDTFNFGDTYLTYPMVIISNKKSHYINALADLNSYEVVVEQGFLTNKWLARDYPNIKVVNALNTMHALQMVNTGQVDAYVGNLAVANYLIASGEMDNIKVAAPTEYGNINYSFVSPKAWPELASILSKGYRNIPAAEHFSIREKWFTLQKVEKTDYILLFGVLVCAGILFLLGGIWNAKIRREKAHTEEALEMLQEVQTVLKSKNEELKMLSTTDVLTGLNNRVKLEEILNDEVRSALRYPQHSFSVIMIDIDRFKTINDTFGHPVGDIVLKSVSSLFKQHIRQVDSLGRWGGEEFLIVCPHSDKNGTITLAENLRLLLESYHHTKVGTVTSSFGVASFLHGDSLDSLLSRADKALYMSKESGRNRVTFL